MAVLRWGYAWLFLQWRNAAKIGDFDMGDQQSQDPAVEVEELPGAYWADLSDFNQDPHNPNAGSLHAEFFIKASVDALGAGRGLVVDQAGTLVSGNHVAEVLGKAGITRALVVPSDGSFVVITQREGWDLDDPDPNAPARQYSIWDNRASDAITYDPEVLQELLDQGMEAGEFWSSDEMEELLEIVAAQDYDDEDYSDLDDEMDGLDGYQEVELSITVPAMHLGQVKQWLANGERQTAPGMGKGILRRCGIL